MSRSVTLTPELATAYRACRAEGLPRDVIAERLGVAHRIVDRFRAELGLHAPPSLWRDPAVVERLLTLRRAGLDCHQIAAALGTTERAVSSKLTRLRREGTKL